MTDEPSDSDLAETYRASTGWEMSEGSAVVDAFLAGIEAGRRTAPATVTRDEIAQSLHNVEFDIEPVSQSFHRDRFYRMADAIMALLPATVTPSRDES